MRRVASGTLKTNRYRCATVLPQSLNTRKARGTLLDQGERVIGCLWRDRHQKRPQFLNLWQNAKVGHAIAHCSRDTMPRDRKPPRRDLAIASRRASLAGRAHPVM